MLQALGLSKSWEQNFLEYVDTLTAYTPDGADLCRKRLQNLFVYDDMMQNRKDHTSTLDGYSLFQAKAYTVDDHYTLFKHDLGKESYLIPFEEPHARRAANADWMNPQALCGAVRGAPPATIRGEIFSVSPYRLFELDKRYENGYSFLRKRIQIIVPCEEKRQVKTYYQQDGKWKYEWTSQERDTIVECWMYLGRKEYWEHPNPKDHPTLDGGFYFRPVRVFKPNKPGGFPYYYHTGNE